MFLRSGETLEGTHNVTGKPRAAPSMAYAMPVLPLVASSRPRPVLLPDWWNLSRPRFSASSTIAAAARSFTEPPGLAHDVDAGEVRRQPLQVDQGRVADAFQQGRSERACRCNH